MKKTLTRIIIAMMLVMSLGVAPVSANSDTNYAGRPLDTSSAGTEASNETRCQMLAYGKVDGRKVIFTANHCLNTRLDGRTIVDEDGVGYANTVTNQFYCSQLYDLCFMWLKTGKWPTNPHQIYSGISGGVTKWTTISTSRGNSSYSCANLPGRVGSTQYEYQQDVQIGTAVPRSGTITSIVNGCQMQTNIPYSATYRHSGSPLMNAGTGGTGSITGIGTAENGGDIIYSSVYEGMQVINDYWITRGTLQGAKFCTTAAC